MDEKQKEELKAKTKFKALIRNTEKKEITENEIFLEYNESSDEINITIHEIPDFTNTDEQYHDVKIECSGEEDKDEIMQYLTDFWEANLPFEFFFIPEVPALVKLGEREYLVYTMKTEQEISYSEIAQILEIDESTVRHHYRNAKAKMEEDIDGTFFFNCKERESPQGAEQNNDSYYSQFKYKLVFESDEEFRNTEENIELHLKQFFDKIPKDSKFVREYY